MKSFKNFALCSLVAFGLLMVMSLAGVGFGIIMIYVLDYVRYAFNLSAITTMIVVMSGFLLIISIFLGIGFAIDEKKKEKANEESNKSTN